MNKIITLFWNGGDDSTFMNLCHQGVLAKAEGLLIRLPIPQHPSWARKPVASIGFLGRLLVALWLPGRGSMPAQGWLSFTLQGKALTQSPLPASQQ